jgi:hypothetical protein
LECFLLFFYIYIYSLDMGLVWQRHAMDRVVLKYYLCTFSHFFIFSNNNQHQNIFTFFTFYTTSIIFYYYSNKKIHYNTKLIHFFI